MCFHFDDKILITYLLLHSSINLLESSAQNEFMGYQPQQVENKFLWKARTKQARKGIHRSEKYAWSSRVRILIPAFLGLVWTWAQMQWVLGPQLYLSKPSKEHQSLTHQSTRRRSMGFGHISTKPVVEVEYELLSNRKKKQRLFGKVSVFQWSLHSLLQGGGNSSIVRLSMEKFFCCFSASSSRIYMRAERIFYSHITQSSLLDVARVSFNLLWLVSFQHLQLCQRVVSQCLIEA